MKTVEIDQDEVLAVDGGRWHIEVVQDGKYEVRLHIETYDGWIAGIKSIRCNSDGSWTIDIERDRK